MHNSCLLKKDFPVEWNGRKGKIHYADSKAVLIDFENTQGCEFYDPSTISAAFSAGVFKVIDINDSGVLIKKKEPMTSDEQALLEHWKAYVLRLDREAKPYGKATLRRVISEIGNSRDEAVDQRPSVSTLYRRYKSWKESNHDYNVLLRRKPTRKRSTRFSKEMLDLAEEVIFDHYLTRGNKSKEECARILSELHTERRLDGNCMSRSRFIQMLSDLDPYEVTLMRKGAEAAKRYRDDYAGEVIIPTFPLEVVEIDAVHLNVGIRDPKTHDYIGTLILYVAIDRYSRCVLGYSSSIKGGGEAGGERPECVVSLLKHMTLPKPYMPHTTNQWTCSGAPRLILCDAGTAFNNQSVTACMALLQTTRAITQTKTPKKKPFIERFFRTLREQFASKMPGYAPNRMRGEVLEEALPKSACLYLEEVHKALDVYINDFYHLNPHRGLDGLAPIEVWNQFSSSLPVSRLVKESDFDNLAGTMREGTLQLKKGVQLNNLFYNSPEVSQLYRKLNGNKTSQKRPKVQFIYNEDDISAITIIDPHDMQMIRVACTDARIDSGTSLKAYKARKATSKKASYQDSGRLKECFRDAEIRKKSLQQEAKRSISSKTKNDPEPFQERPDTDLEMQIKAGHSGATKRLDKTSTNTTDGENTERSVFKPTKITFTRR